VAVAQKLDVIGWLLLAVLASGLGVRLGRPLAGPFTGVHKLASLLVLVFIAIRIVPVFRAFASQHAFIDVAAVFVLSFVTAFTTGVLESIPSRAGALWLNLHRISAVATAIAAALAARLLFLAAR
jgi:hypothetical protein